MARAKKVLLIGVLLVILLLVHFSEAVVMEEVYDNIEDGYVEVELSLNDGPLYIFTDGATEGTLEDGSMFEKEGVESLLEEHKNQPLTFRLNSIVNAIHRGEGTYPAWRLGLIREGDVNTGRSHAGALPA